MLQWLRSCGSLWWHIWHRESSGKKHTGVICTSFRNTFSSLQLCRVFYGGKTLLLVVTSCQRLLVGRRDGTIHPRPARLRRLLLPGSRQRHPFPFQPSLSDSRSNVKSEGMHLVAIFCGMTSWQACRWFLFGDQQLLHFKGLCTNSIYLLFRLRSILQLRYSHSVALPWYFAPLLTPGSRNAFNI